MERLKLLILYGGPSEEHAVSVKSAREVARHVDRAKVDPLYVSIQRDGTWLLMPSPEAETGGLPAALTADPHHKGLLLLQGGHYETLPVDAAFPLLHGQYGEDGTVQGALTVSGIPYVGCGIAASTLCMDKALTYQAAAAAGVRVPRHRVISSGEGAAADGLIYPLFVKPARSGSSFGVSKVDRPDDLQPAMEAARAYDDKILLEEAVCGLEIGCAVMGNDRLTVGDLDQITLSGGFFRIHQEAKPEAGSENATVRVPAPIPPGASALVRQTAQTVYRALGCRGLARVDLFLTPGGVILNEVNTMPGFTSYSRYPRMMTSAGIPMGEVIDRLIALAMEKSNNA